MLKSADIIRSSAWEMYHHQVRKCAVDLFLVLKTGEVEAMADWQSGATEMSLEIQRKL